MVKDYEVLLESIIFFQNGKDSKFHKKNFEINMKYLDNHDYLESWAFFLKNSYPFEIIR